MKQPEIIWPKNPCAVISRLPPTNDQASRLLVNTIPNIVYKRLPDCPVEFFDDKIQALTGYGADEFNSRKLKWSDIIVTEDLETDRQF
ncbi:MAG: hypothetical protein PVJ20_06610 [Desulfobacterales bacterium]